jgi:perosamine synthetase
MDVLQIEAAITPRTRAIMPVHIYGHPVDMDPIRQLARKHGLVIVEDAAEAHGAEYKGQRCGSLGDLSCFSFYANKIITTGEGGMVLTNRDDLAERLRSARNLCFKPERRFFHTDLGHNFRFTNTQAAIGLAQVEEIESALAHKRWMASAYGKRLANVGALQLPIEEPWAKNVYWMYGVVLDEGSGMDAAAFAKKLGERGIMTRPFFLGMHEQPALHERGFCRGQSFPVAERLARQGLYLPSGMTLTQAQVDQTCDAVEAVLGHGRS